MSNRILERVTSTVGSTGPTDVNITEEAGVLVAPPIGPGDNVPLPGAPFFSVGSVLYAWDGVQFQRLRVDGEKVLLTHEAYFRAGENPFPESPGTTLSDALRTKRGETPRAVHLPRATLPSELVDVERIFYFTDQAAYPMLPGTARITYWVTYYPNPNPDIVGGQVLLTPYWGNGTDECPDTAVNPGDFPMTGQQATLTLYQTTFVMNAAVDKNPVRFTVSMDVPAGATTCRLLAKEIGGSSLGGGEVEIAITTSS